MFGMVLYSLDRLYNSVKRHAEASGEWQWLVLISISCLLTFSVKWILYLHPLIIPAR